MPRFGGAVYEEITMKFLLLLIPLIFFSWALIHGGTKKKMPTPPGYIPDDEVQYDK